MNESERMGPGDYLIIAPCYDKDTEILTKDNGWKLFKDLVDEDQVATLKGNEIIFKKPTEIYEYFFKGELIGLKHSQVDLLVTPNHRIFYKEAYWGREYDWKVSEAQDIYGKRIKLKRWGVWKNGKKRDKDFYEFLGFWFADGCAEYNEKSRKYRITLTQKKDVKYVDDLLNRVGFPYFKNKRQTGGFNWVIYDKKMAKEFTSFGKALTKNIPPEIKDADVDSLRAFIKGFEKGDGKQGGKQRILFTGSKSLADDLQEICNKCGDASSIHKINHKSWKNSQYYVSILKRYGKEPIIYKNQWFKKEYDEKVYCVKIDNGEGVLLVRRNGISIWCGNTYKILQQSTMQKFQELVPQGWGTFNKAESVFRTIDGRTFFLRSAEHPESIEGITAKAIWADEASLMKADAWLMMQGRVSRTQGRILCTFTPIALNWIYKELEKDKARVLRGDPSDIEFIQFRSVDSPYFPKEEFERARRMLTPTQFQLRYEGIFGKAEGLIYPDFSKYNIVDDIAIPKDWTKAGGIDWGYNNPFVALEGALSPDDVLFIYKERYKNRCLLKEHAEYLNPDITYFADPSGKQEIEEMIALGFDVQSANNDVNLGIQKVNERIRPTTDNSRSIRLKVFKSCVNTINEKSLYRYDKDKEKPVKEDDHCMDSERYLIMGLDEWGSAGDIEWV